MSDVNNDDLDPRERDLFRSLPGAGATSRSLEDRVVRTLLDEGLIVRSSRRWTRFVKAGGFVAALAAAFALGTQVGGKGGDTISEPAPKTITVPESSPSSTPVLTIPEEYAHTAFHKDLEPPLSDELEPDRYTMLANSIER
jgi:hypothetical protein